MFFEGQASLPLRRQEGSHGRGHSPPQSLRPGSTEQSVLVLMNSLLVMSHTAEKVCRVPACHVWLMECLIWHLFF